MSDRVIYGSDYEPSPDSPLSRWLEANGVDAFDVPADTTITVTGGQVTYTAFVRDAGGQLQLDPDLDSGPGRLYLRELRTVPLTASPEAFGL